jgi:hypothetical protein
MSTVPVPDELVAQLEHRLHFAGPETGFPRAGSRIEETSVADGVKTLVLIIDWARPLHVVVFVDDIREEERIVTVYEPDKERWSADFKV